MSTLISVIIPTFNASEPKLMKSLSSLIAQKNVFVEIIVVDDGSNVPFSNLHKKYDNNIISWCELSSNVGVAKARNIGIRNCNGHYVAFLDAGDWWAEDKLHKQMLLYEQYPDCSFVYCSALKVYPDGRSYLLKAKERGQVTRKLLTGQPITGSCSSVLTTKANLINVGGFYEENDIPEDRDLWLRLSRLGHVEFVDEPLCFLEEDQNSRTADPYSKKITFARFNFIHESELRKEKLWSSAWANYHTAIANRFFKNRRLFLGLKHLFCSFLRSPNLYRLLRHSLQGSLHAIAPSVYINLLIKKRNG